MGHLRLVSTLYAATGLSLLCPHSVQAGTLNPALPRKSLHGGGRGEGGGGGGGVGVLSDGVTGFVCARAQIDRQTVDRQVIR